MTSVGEDVPQQIKRVTALKEQYIALRALGPRVLVEPAIAMMTASIDRALDAIGSGDVIAMLRAWEDLKGFEE